MNKISGYPAIHGLADFFSGLTLRMIFLTSSIYFIYRRVEYGMHLIIVHAGGLGTASAVGRAGIIESV